MSTHWLIFRGDQLIPTEMAEEFDAGEFPSLEQAADMASGVLRRDSGAAATPAKPPPRGSRRLPQHFRVGLRSLRRTVSGPGPAD